MSCREKQLESNMKFIYIITTLSFVLLASLIAETSVDIKFDSDQAIKHLEAPGPGVTYGKILGGKSCLVLKSDVGSQAIRSIPVKPLQKYKMTIRAAVESAETIEANDRISKIMRMSRGKGFATCEVKFFNKDGHEVTFKLYGHTRGTAPVRIISQKAIDYVAVFYAPARAESLQILFEPRSRMLIVERVIVAPEVSEGTVNCNPDFRYGDFSLCGWNPGAEGGAFKLPNGATVLKCGEGGRGVRFPVDDSAKYSFHCKGTDYSDQGGKVMVSFYNSKGDQLGSTHLFWGKDMVKGGSKKNIQPLPGSTSAVISASKVILEYVKVTAD